MIITRWRWMVSHADLIEGNGRIHEDIRDAYLDAISRLEKVVIKDNL